MKKIISILLALCILIGCSTVLVSCGAPEDDGAEILVHLGDIVYDLDPSDYFVDDNAQQLLSLLYEPLFKLSASGKLQMAAAKSYHVNRKDRIITINLRQTYWSDKRAVQAQDFIYTWRDRIINPSMANPAAALFFDVENAIEIKNGKIDDLYAFGARALDVDTIEITYREGADVNQLLKNLASVATAPVRQDVVDVTPDYWSKRVDNIVTNGPFTIKSYAVEHMEEDETQLISASISLQRNRGYHQSPDAVQFNKQVTPGSIVCFWAGEQAQELTYDKIENQTIFFMGEMSAEVRAQYEKRAKVADMLSTYCYAFNTTNPLFADANVRRALSLALDRQAMADAIVFGKAAEGFHPDTKKLLSTDADTVTAEELLVSAGVTSGSFTLTVNDDEDSLILAEMAKEAWEGLGFTVTVEAVDFRLTKGQIIDAATGDTVDIKDSAVQAMAKNATAGAYEFDVIGLDWQMYSHDKLVALTAFTSDMNGCGYNVRTGEVYTSITGFSSDVYDALIDAVYAASNKRERKTAIEAAELGLLEASPIIPVIYNQNYTFVGKLLKGVKTDGFGNFVFTKANLKKYQDFTVDKLFGKDDESAE